MLPALLASNNKEGGFVELDSLHRTVLDAPAPRAWCRRTHAGRCCRTDLVRTWHRLDPWPGFRRWLTRLKQPISDRYAVNGNISLMINMARRAGLPWDAILGAEIARAYKPAGQAYLATAAALDIAPEELCLVAAHHGDNCGGTFSGLMTALHSRPWNMAALLHP
ncbi:MAG: hypothetical protein IPI83_07790 [Sphingomonadales bacterium]|nr:hypothetical protein [Sphingomonadales bacterium]